MMQFCVESEQSLYVECVAECLAESGVCGSVNLRYAEYVAESLQLATKVLTHQLLAESLAECV